MLAVECVETLDGFENLRKEWNTLARLGSAFQTWEWSWSWWLRYSAGRRLFILTVYDKERLIGIAPFCAYRYFGLPLRIIGFIGSGCSDYGDLIVDKGREDDVVEALARFLSHDGRWDALDLQQLAAGSAALGFESSLEDITVTRLEQDECFSLELPGSYETFLASLSKKFRWNVGYYRRRLDREGALAFRRAVDQGTIDSDIKKFFSLHQKRFISKKKLGRFVSPRFVAFHHDVARRMLEAQKLGLFFLEMDGRPVATLYGFESGETFYYYLSGFEPAWGKLSVSTVLLSMVFEECIGRGITRFDFLRGSEPYKLKWGASGRHNSRLVIARPSWRSEMAARIIRKENDFVVKVKAKEAEI